jgi:hypothetical protein
MTYASSAERAEFLAGLRDLIDYMESNPDVPVTSYATVYAFPADDEWDGKCSEIDRIAALIGVPAVDTSGGHYLALRTFGPVEYRAVAIPSSDTESK